MKTKRNILISLFAMALMVMGIGVVKADVTPLAPTGYEIMCLDGDKDSVITKKNGTTLCYVVAIKFTATGETSGFMSQAYSGDGLKIIGTEKYAAGSNSLWVLASSAAGTNSKASSDTNSDLPSAFKNGKVFCPAATFASKDSALKNGVETSGCGMFYSPAGGDSVFTKANMTDSKAEIVSKDMQASNDYAVIGAFKVQITAEEGKGCGQICVQTTEVKEEVDWACIATATGTGTPTREDGSECPSDMRTVISEPPCVEVDYNITPEVKPEPENEKTGAFASYTILAAGALIAISAITIAKKHNRISKI